MIPIWWYFVGAWLLVFVATVLYRCYSTDESSKKSRIQKITLLVSALALYIAFIVFKESSLMTRILARRIQNYHAIGEGAPNTWSDRQWDTCFRLFDKKGSIAGLQFRDMYRTKAPYEVANTCKSVAAVSQ